MCCCSSSCAGGFAGCTFAGCTFAAKVQSNPPGVDVGAGEPGPGLSRPLGEGEYPAVREQGEQLHCVLCISCVAAYAAVQVTLVAAQLLAAHLLA